jgi:superfamily I DNA and RNA helicase
MPEAAEEPLDELLETDLPGLVERAIQNGGSSVSRYDAILVDEGQDFNLTWWTFCAKSSTLAER